MNNCRILFVGLIFVTLVCSAQTGLVTQIIGENVNSSNIVNMLSPVLEMSRSEVSSDDGRAYADFENCVYKTSKKGLRLATRNRKEVHKIEEIYVNCRQLPKAVFSDGNLSMPFRHDQIASCMTLLSYCGLPEVVFYRSNSAVFYEVSQINGSVCIFADQTNPTNIYEIGIRGAGLGDIRKIPETSKYRDQNNNFKIMFPPFIFKKGYLESDGLSVTPSYSVTNIIGSPVINKKVKLPNGIGFDLEQKRKVVFTDYDISGAITSRVQFVEYATLRNWLRIVSMRNGTEQERVIQVSIDINEYKNKGRSILRLPSPLASYSSPDTSDGDIWMVCPDLYEYDVCLEKNGWPTWMSYKIRDDGEFELKTLFFSQGNISPRYSYYSAYLYRSSNWRFFILPGAHENGGMKNWE